MDNFNCNCDNGEKMLILAIDSSAKVAAAALAEDDRVICSVTENCGLTHSETLLPIVAALYERAGKSPAETGLFCVSVGPGSFTGVRIGISLIKGMAFGRGRCVGVSTLEALAYNLRNLSGVACAVMDARRGQLYNAIFETGGGSVRRLCADRVITKEELAAQLDTLPSPVYLCGDGYDIMEREAPRSVVKTPTELIAQNAESVALLGYREYLLGKYTSDELLRPVYLRAPQAERERNERLAALEAERQGR